MKASSGLQLINLFKNLKARHKKMYVVVLDFSTLMLSTINASYTNFTTTKGIRGTTLNWIQNFLTNRTQKVVVNSSSSESAHVKSGEPKGTVLGPLLFFTHVNGLPSTVFSQIRFLAVDCLLYRLINFEQIRKSCRETYLRYRTWQIDGDVLQPLKMLGSEGVEAEIKKMDLQYIFRHIKDETLGSF